MRVIALDTLDPDTGEAFLCETRLEWLEKALNGNASKPTLLAMHHQPLLTRLGLKDTGFAFKGAKELKALISQHPQVKWVTCGHLHRQIIFSLGQVPVTVAPSATCIRTLTINNDMPKEFVNEPPAYLVFIWHPKLGVVCHNNLIGDFGPPQPMR